MGQFTADGAYDGKPTYNAAINHNAAAAIVIPPCANAVEPIDDRGAGQRDQHIAAISRGDRMKWQGSCGYGSVRWSRLQEGDRSPSSVAVCGHNRCLASRPKSPSAAPPATECLTAHAQNPSAVRQTRNNQPFQRLPFPSNPDPCDGGRD